MVNCQIEIHSGHCFNCYSPEEKGGVRIWRPEWVMCYRLPITAELKINNENVLFSDELNKGEFELGEHIDLCLACIAQEFEKKRMKIETKGK